MVWNRNARSTVAVVVAAGAVAVLAGCSSGTASSGGTASAAASASAAAAVSASGGAIAGAVAAYEAMWQDVATATTTANYQDPRLADHATGQALTTNTAVIKYDHDHGVVGKGEPVLHPKGTVLASTTDEVQIQDCMDATHWLEYHASGGLLDNTPGGKHRISATVSYTGSVWRVSYLVVGGVGTC